MDDKVSESAVNTQFVAKHLGELYWAISGHRFHSWGNMQEREPSPDHEFLASPTDRDAPVQPQELLRTISVIARSSMNERVGYYLRSLVTLYEVHGTSSPDNGLFRWPGHAIYPLARSVIENASLITWLSDPIIDVEHRVQRVAKFFRYSDFWEAQFNQAAGGHTEARRHAEIINALVAKTGKYNPTEPVLSSLGEDGMRAYNRWSAVGHGAFWPVDGSLRLEHDEERQMARGVTEPDVLDHIHTASIIANVVAQTLDSWHGYWGTPSDGRPDEIRHIALLLTEFAANT